MMKTLKTTSQKIYTNKKENHFHLQKEHKAKIEDLISKISLNNKIYQRIN